MKMIINVVFFRIIATSEKILHSRKLQKIITKHFSPPIIKPIARKTRLSPYPIFSLVTSLIIRNIPPIIAPSIRDFPLISLNIVCNIIAATIFKIHNQPQTFLFFISVNVHMHKKIINQIQYILSPITTTAWFFVIHFLNITQISNVVE